MEDNITQDRVTNVRAYRLLPGDSIVIHSRAYEIKEVVEYKTSSLKFIFINGSELHCHCRSLQQKLQ